jgi:hypothetical protein
MMHSIPTAEDHRSRCGGIDSRTDNSNHIAGSIEYPALLDGDGSPMELLDQLGALKLREAHIREKFTAVPQLDYIGAKTKIESLNTQLLAERIDERLIEFHDHKRNDALALGKIIQKKEFPR